jgi:hypothetical protein
MKKYILIFLFIVNYLISFAQDTSKTEDPEITYTRVITERADKIVSALNLSDSVLYFGIRDIVIEQYRNLRNIYDKRDIKIKILREQANLQKETRDSLIDAVKNETIASLYTLHFKFISQLSVLLTPQQIDIIKDGMTYNILPRTYNVYLEMLPYLTDEHKRFIMACLIEARENAIDAESSDKKHAIFGKYKGRINNYLSAAGYDLKKAEKEMLDNKKN